MGQTDSDLGQTDADMGQTDADSEGKNQICNHFPGHPNPEMGQISSDPESGSILTWELFKSFEN